jgi:D-xylose transport system ATP-binding protein
MRALLSDGEMEKRARETLASLSVRTVSSVRQLVSRLSGGQRQTVAIAKAVLWNSKVVFLDEPTAALGVAQTRQVLDLVRRLADQGRGVALISHNMNDVMEVADRVVALYLGRVAAEVKKSDTNTTQIVELITSGRSGSIGLAAATVNESI